MHDDWTEVHDRLDKLTEWAAAATKQMGDLVTSQKLMDARIKQMLERCDRIERRFPSVAQNPDVCPNCGMSHFRGAFACPGCGRKLSA